MPVRVRPTAPSLLSPCPTLSVNPRIASGRPIPIRRTHEGCRRPFSRSPRSVLLLLLAASTAQAAYSPATTNGWFIIAGRVAGLTARSSGRTSGSSTRTPTASATVTLIFHPPCSGGAPRSPVSLDAGSRWRRGRRVLPRRDVRQPVPAGDGDVGLSGVAVERAGDGRRPRSTRLPPTGTFGFFLPGDSDHRVDGTQDRARPTPSNVLQMYGLNSGDTNFRTNLDVTNTSNVALPIEVRVIDPVTTQVYGGTRNVQRRREVAPAPGRDPDDVGRAAGRRPADHGRGQGGRHGVPAGGVIAAALHARQPDPGRLRVRRAAAERLGRSRRECSLCPNCLSDFEFRISRLGHRVRAPFRERVATQEPPRRQDAAGRAVAGDRLAAIGRAAGRSDSGRSPVLRAGRRVAR